MSRSTIFFPTCNRPHFLRKCFENFFEFCPRETINLMIVSNEQNEQKYNKVLEDYKDKLNYKVFDYFQDPGTAICYNDLFQNALSEFAIVWADDVFFLRSIEHLYEKFDNDPNLKLIALPMIDNLDNSPLIGGSWPKDQFGCALWNTVTGRCAHHSIVKSEYFQKYDTVYTKDEYIDVFFHNHTLTFQRYWPNDGSYILHTRYDDEVRYNMKIENGVYRFSEQHKFFEKNKDILTKREGK